MARKVKIVSTVLSTDSAGNVVDALPVREETGATLDAAGKYVDPIAVEVDEDFGAPVRYVDGLLTTDSAGRVVPVIPITGGDLGGTLLGDQEFYTAGSYIAYASPWGALLHGYTSGNQFTDTIRVYPETFPDASIITWDQPDAEPTLSGVWGYMHLAYGNYDGGVPETPVTPYQVENLSSWTETVDFTLSGDTDDHNVLAEMYLTGTSGDDTDKLFEVGWLLHTCTADAAFVATGTLIGTWTDPQAREWTCVNTGPGPTGADFILFMPTNEADVTGVLDRKHALDFLVTEAAISGGEWVNGASLGVEPHQGAGTMSGIEWSVSFTGVEAGVNLLADYQDISTADWTKENATTPASNEIREAATTSVHGIYRAAVSAPQAAGNYRFRCIVKPDLGRQKIYAYASHNFTSRGLVWFDLDTNTVSNVTGTGAAGYIIDLPDGEKLCILDFQAQANDTLRVSIRTRSDAGATSFLGDTAKGMHIRDMWLGAR